MCGPDGGRIPQVTDIREVAYRPLRNRTLWSLVAAAPADLTRILRELSVARTPPAPRTPGGNRL
jgi:hypothetical protein